MNREGSQERTITDMYGLGQSNWMKGMGTAGSVSSPVTCDSNGCRPASCTSSMSLSCYPTTDCGNAFEFAFNNACWVNSLDQWQTMDQLQSPTVAAIPGPTLDSTGNVVETPQDISNQQVTATQQANQTIIGSQAALTTGGVDQLGTQISDLLWNNLSSTAQIALVATGMLLLVILVRR